MTGRAAGRVAGVAVTAGVVALLAGCGGIPPEPFVVARAASASPAPDAVTAEQLRGEFDAFVAARGGEVALAWAPVGQAGRVQTLGATTDVDAWSTMKVPIAIAALGDGVGDAERDPKRVAQAIERSDNDAAAALWRSLGGRDEAIAAVEGVLRAGGDRTTRVTIDQTGRARGFGRTAWQVSDAARFAAGLPCLAATSPAAGAVYDEMARITPDHRWGLGALTGSAPRFKGGWGPSTHGYLVRQIGTLDHDGGRTAVAFVVRPANGAHETATATASALVTWFGGHLGAAEAGTCPDDPTDAQS